MSKARQERVVAYFVVNNKDVTVHGTIMTKFSDKSDQVYYELFTDNPVHFQIRDKEIYLKAKRTVKHDNSLFVRTDQCVLDNPDHQEPKHPAPNHPTSHNGAAPGQRKTRFTLGDLITLPLDGGTNRLINGTVGYCGIHYEREVVELCADPIENTSAFICGIRNKYEVPKFPDEQRHNDMKGFSLVVDANTVLPRDGSSHPPVHRQESFSQPVGSRQNPGPSSGYPQDRGYDGVSIDEIGSENHLAMIQNLIFEEPLQVVTEYGAYDGYFKCIFEFEGQFHVGVELERVPMGPISFWKTPDGVHHDTRLFDCYPGRGALVHVNRCRVLYSQSQQLTISEESTLRGLPNLFDESHITITRPGESYPPLNSIRDILGDKRGIQGHMNSCYMDSSLFGMFAFSSSFDTLFLKVEDKQSQGMRDESIQRYRDVRTFLQTRIVFPLRKAKFVRADQIMMLRTELNNAGTINGMLSNEKDPEEFLKVLLQHVLNAEPYLKLKCGEHVNSEYIYQIFSTKQCDVTLPTVQFLLEHSFKEQKIILDSAPHVLLLQMPRFGKDFKVYPRIFPSLQLSLDNLTSTTYGPKCIMCLGDATYRCPECEDIQLYYYTSVFVFYCDSCEKTVHNKRREHKPIPLMLPKGVGNLPPGKMELFAVLAIEKSHYVCFSRCGNKWVMFDSMADRVGSNFGRNIPRVTELPNLEEWLSSPQRMLDWMASDRKSTQIPPYLDRITKDNYICMYHSDQVNMF